MRPQRVLGLGESIIPLRGKAVAQAAGLGHGHG